MIVPKLRRNCDWLGSNGEVHIGNRCQYHLIGKADANTGGTRVEAVALSLKDVFTWPSAMSRKATACADTVMLSPLMLVNVTGVGTASDEIRVKHGDWLSAIGNHFWAASLQPVAVQLVTSNLPERPGYLEAAR